MTTEERLSRIETKLASLEQMIEARFAPKPAPKPAAIPAWAGPQGAFGSGYGGAPSDPSGGSIPFGGSSSRVPIDGVRRDADGCVIVNEPAPPPPGPARAPAHQQAVELADAMLPLKGP